MHDHSSEPASAVLKREPGAPEPVIMVSILVVSFNTLKMTLDCVRSILTYCKGIDFEILIGDNGSTDGSAQALRELALNDSRIFFEDFSRNLGFAQANNALATRAKGDWILLLNPDTELTSDAVAELVEFASHYRHRGIFGGRTLYSDGSLNPTSCWGPYTLWSTFSRAIGLTHLLPGSDWANPRSYPRWNRRGIREVGMVTGCFFLLRRQDWDQLGGFDPDFFVYGEEADLCWRARSMGMSCVINGEIFIIHHGSQSETSDFGKLIKIFDGEMRLLRRHWKGLRFVTGVALVQFGVLVRALAESILRRRSRLWRDLWHHRQIWMKGARGIATGGASDLHR